MTTVEDLMNWLARQDPGAIVKAVDTFGKAHEPILTAHQPKCWNDDIDRRLVLIQSREPKKKGKQ